MEVGRVAVTLVITALIVLTGHQNGFVSAATSVTESSSTAATTTTTTTVESVTTGGSSKQTSEPISSTTATTTTTAAASNSTHASSPGGLADDPLFHTVMIVMIAVLGFIVIFSVSCGLCVIYGIDIGCPIPCCGGSGKEKIPGSSANGMKLKRSLRTDRISSQRLQDAEEFKEVECKGFKGHESAYGQDNPVYEF